MRTLLVILALSLLLLLLATQFAACSRSEDITAPTEPRNLAAVHSLPDGKYPVLVEYDGQVERSLDRYTKQNGDHLIYVEDFEIGDGGWVPVDLDAQHGVFWHHTLYDDGHEERGVMWCGTDSSELRSPPGYGNLWKQDLWKEFVLTEGNIISFSLQYHLEAGYDYLYVEASLDDGQSFTRLKEYTWWGGDSFFSDTAVIPGVTGQSVIIRFRIVSDAAWSDEDMLFDSNGACRLDEVRVPGYDADTFETGSDGWIAEAGPSAGGGPFRRESELAGLGEDHGYALAAYDLDGPHAGEFPFTSYQDLSYGHFVQIGMESPVIELPTDGDWVFLLDFDVYADLPPSNLVFYTMQVAAPPPEEGGVWMNYPAWFYGPGPAWVSRRLNISNYVPRHASSMRIRLIALDGTLLVPLPQPATHTPAPFFDNVAISAVRPVAFDIMPNSCPNVVSMNEQGVLPAVICGTADFDVQEIDPASLSISMHSAGTHAWPTRHSFKDVGTPPDSYDLCSCIEKRRDHVDDLTLKFDMADVIPRLGWAQDGQEVVVILWGSTYDGIPISGANCIVIHDP